MQYSISNSSDKIHFLQIEVSLGAVKLPCHIQLPAWRPGRYELGNFAKNIRNFGVFDQKGKSLDFEKVSREKWLISDQAYSDEIFIRYEYFADQLNAGSSYVDDNILYVNPVNCLIYNEEALNKVSSIKLLIPEKYKVACQLPFKNQTLYASNFHELADSPFIASAGIETLKFPFEYNGKIHSFYFHFWGKHSIPTERLIADTIAYARVQCDVFGEFPCESYHFLYLMLAYPFRHGVEHSDSTVIAMGMGSDDIAESFYHDFLAISSHELFHLWNVKRLRPYEMWPYDYSKENYSRLGYVYEGVTTYYGDKMLLKSGVWDIEQYLDSLNGDWQKHIKNDGRYNYSVAESSFDTWIDGYTPGVPGRKVSIYTEGMLAALIADLMIMDQTKSQYSLDDVLRDLYHNCFHNNRGYTEIDYKQILEGKTRNNWDLYFSDIIHGKNNYENYLIKYLPKIGLKIDSDKILFSPEKEFDEKMFAKWTAQSAVFSK